MKHRYISTSFLGFICSALFVSNTFLVLLFVNSKQIRGNVDSNLSNSDFYKEKTSEIPKSEILNEMKGAPFACGPATMAVALTILKVPFTNWELKELRSENLDSDFYALSKFALSKGLYTEAISIEPGQLFKLKNLAILQIVSSFAQDSAGSQNFHFLVFAGAVPERKGVYEDMVYLYDSRTGGGMRGPFPLDELSEFWTGKALVISKYPIDLTTIGIMSQADADGTSWLLILLFPLAILIVYLMLTMIVKKRKNAKITRFIAIAPFFFLFNFCTIFAQKDMNGIQITNESTETSSNDEELSINAGLVEKGTLIERIFIIKNHQKEKMNIWLGKKSCACLDAKIIDSNSIPPGQQSRIKVAIYAIKAGQIQHGVMLHTSFQRDPIPLFIKATVDNDTTISPENIDFGDFTKQNEILSRPLRLWHICEKQKTFKIDRTNLSTEAINIELVKEKKEQTEEGFTKYSYEWNVFIRPAKCIKKSINENIELLAISDNNTPLRFLVTCTGNILQPITANPSKIFKVYSSSAPIKADIRLYSSIYKDLEIDKVNVEGLKCERISQRKESDKEGFIIEMSLIPQENTSRAEGICQITLKRPSNEMINIPILILNAKENR